MEYIAEIKKLLGSKKLIIGSDRTFKLLKTGKLTKVVIAKNANKKMKDDIEYYGSQVEIIQTEKTNEELGVLCKKPFAISVLGVAK